MAILTGRKPGVNERPPRNPRPQKTMAGMEAEINIAAIVDRGYRSVDLEGFEPSASSVRLKRAPNCATGPHGQRIVPALAELVK